MKEEKIIPLTHKLDQRNESIGVKKVHWIAKYSKFSHKMPDLMQIYAEIHFLRSNTSLIERSKHHQFVNLDEMLSQKPITHVKSVSIFDLKSVNLNGKKIDLILSKSESAFRFNRLGSTYTPCLILSTEFLKMSF